MARKVNMGLLALVAVAALVQASVATTYQVGDSVGWLRPSGNAAVYSSWAANKSFAVGDVLVFNFQTGAHDVATVSKSAFDSCNGTSPILLQNSGPANVTLNSTGEHYFICTIGDHCIAGQKLAVNVTGTPTSTTTPPPPPPPPSSSATSVGAAGLAATLLSIAVAFMF